MKKESITMGIFSDIEGTRGYINLAFNSLKMWIINGTILIKLLKLKVQENSKIAINQQKHQQGITSQV